MAKAKVSTLVASSAPSANVDLPPPSPTNFLLNGALSNTSNKVKVGFLSGELNTITVIGDDFDPVNVDFVLYAPGLSLYDFEVSSNPAPTATKFSGSFRATGLVLPGLRFTVTIVVFNRAGSIQLTVASTL